ncbi:MAG: THUMP domain-containing protein, partial [Desulfobulbaceae bacterium]|nr:THUMP domain-containing protein [Desulfobulbaceae bacterium]
MSSTSPSSNNKNIDYHVFTATCAGGLEDLLTGEVRACNGENISAGPGFVTWNGPLESAYRLCLWSRFASRVLLQLASFSAESTDSLYDGALKIDWQDHFGPENTMAVACTLTKTHLTHNQFAALRIKDA